MRRTPFAAAVLAGLVLLFAGCEEKPFTVSWESQESHLNAAFWSLSVVDDRTVWACGSGSQYAFTRDGGVTWESGKVPDGRALDLRDVEAFEGGTAYLLSIGAGDLSRIYKTEDWGESWILQHTSPYPAGFYNGMAFWDEQNGVVAGDPVDGRLFLVATSDGGESWKRLESPDLPATEESEVGFAASGTHLATFGENGLAVTSGGSVARVFLSTDRGRSWSVVPTPVFAGTTTRGIFSIAFRDSRNAAVAGGDYALPNATERTLALSSDGGMSWTLAPGPHEVGFRSAIAWREDRSHPMWVAVGTSGSSYSPDEGLTWIPFDTVAYAAVAFSGSRGWAVGPSGAVARLVAR
jgi:photosystem II stability/assembly factor-like uncharacterized protein